MRFLLLLAVFFIEKTSTQETSWLNSLPAEAKADFETAINNQNLTKAELVKELDELGAKQPEPFKVI